MLADLKEWLRLAHEARLECEHVRARHLDNLLAWESLSRVLDNLDGTIDALLAAYAEVVAQEKDATPNPEVAS
jgi:hypothetical protein